MAVSAILSIGLPVILLVVFKKKNGWLPAFLIGCGVFIVFALILEQIFHSVILGTFGSTIQNNIYLYGLYGGLTAALFEETGRWIAFRFFLKKHQNAATALMYGTGHGGAEAILIVGLTYINNIIAAVMINAGMIDKMISMLDDNMKLIVYGQLSLLWTLPAGMYLMAGVERIFAITLQLSFSVLVYIAVKNRKAWFWLIAFIIHFLVDFMAVVLADSLNTSAVEIIIAIMTCAAVMLTMKLYQKQVSNPEKWQ
jgi:uncharacterized membrane protein YhfC